MVCEKCGHINKTRSTKYNATYYKFIVLPLADKHGWTKELAHAYLKSIVLGYEEPQTGIWIVPETKGMSNKTFYDYVERCIRYLAMEEDIVVRMPGDISSLIN